MQTFRWVDRPEGAGRQAADVQAKVQQIRYHSRSAASLSSLPGLQKLSLNDMAQRTHQASQRTSRCSQKALLVVHMPLKGLRHACKASSPCPVLAFISTPMSAATATMTMGTNVAWRYCFLAHCRLADVSTQGSQWGTGITLVTNKYPPIRLPPQCCCYRRTQP